MSVSTDGPFGLVAWWQLGLAANVVICVAYFAIAGLILIPLVRAGQLRRNKLAVATAAIFFSSAIGRAVLAVQAIAAVPGTNSGAMDAAQLTTWWITTAHLVTAVVAISYLALRRHYGTMFGSGPLFEDLLEKQRVAGLEELAAAGAARDRARAERDANEHMLKSIIQDSQAAIYVKDLQGRYLMGNPKLAEIMGRPMEEILGKCDELLDPKMAPTWRANDVRARAGSYQLDEWHDAFPDGRHYYQSVKFPLFDEAGELYATCGMSLDVTEQRRAVHALAEARDAALAAAAAKSNFLATMSHEIRTPINAVIGMTDLLLGTSLDDQQTEFADMVHSSGLTLLAVINDILDYSKIEAGELMLESTPFDLVEEIEGCLDLVAVAADTKGLDLVSHIDPSCPARLTGDPVRLGRIVSNLLSNAVKFTEEGEVLVTASAMPADDGRIQVSISVTDTGIGIAPAGIETLFRSFTQVDPSTTRVYGGTGLGLAISQRLAEAMDGRLEVTSEPCAGSTFTAILVLDPSSDAGQVDDLARASAPELAGKSVLLVDDNPTNLHILDLQLSNVGMACTSVTTAAEAIELISQGISYDVAVLDMNMPDMNGVELGRELRQATSVHLPLVLLTSIGTHPGDVSNIFEAMLTKPVKSVHLRRTLRLILDPILPLETDHRLSGMTAWQPPPDLRILLAEDNMVNQRVAQLTLQKLGYTVDTVVNGREAVGAVLAAPYDVVLMDIQMPLMDGLEATREIRASLPLDGQPRIIAVTASALVEDRVACAAAGMDGYLAKPVRAADLRAVLGNLRAADRTTIDGAGPGTAEQQAATGPAPIDESVLAELTEQVDGAEGNVMRDELIRSYLDESSLQLQQIAAAARDADAATVAGVAHSMRSTSAMVGARRLVDLLLEAEKVARTSSGDVSSVAEPVVAEHDRVTEALRGLLARETPVAAP